MQPTRFSQSKIRALIAEGEYALAKGPHPERARFDSEMLLLHLFRRADPERNRAWLLAHWNNPTTHVAEHRSLIQRRAAGEPVQYIVGETEFYGLPFRVTRDVLIPRPETEHLVEKAIQLAQQFERPRIVDVGTGSGAIAVALAHNLPQAEIAAIDISPRAIDIAQENASRNGVANRIRCLYGDLLAPVASEQFDIVVSNPPYVPETDRASLSIEVRDHEPATALFSGDDGLDLIRKLIPQAFAVLAPGGALLMEFGYGQWPAINSMLEDSGFQQIDFIPDLQSIPRIAVGKRPLN